jgi:hypothetical protein
MRPWKYKFILLICFQSVASIAQTAWPSESWSSAVNLTSVMDPAGLTELSGLFWNYTTNRLYVSHGDGRLRVLQLNTNTNSFSQIADLIYPGGPEGITQVNLAANEFYTVDEDNYQIRKYTHAANFSSLTMTNSWNLLAAPSTMTNTGNTGPEGIAFIPDSFLTAAGFISQQTGNLYTSLKGMGGLIFIAHQNMGYIWVFDVNANVSNDFLFVGKYKSNKTESCDLAFDQSTGLLYIQHNIGGNTIEVTNLTTVSLPAGERKFTVLNEYFVANPSGNINVEGLAISPKCSDSSNVSLWLCRDVESTESSSYKKDCLRWFNPFASPGSCNPSMTVTVNLKVFIEGLYTSYGIMTAAVNSVAYPALCDTIVLELHSTNSPYELIQSAKSTINTSGNGIFVFPQISPGSNYYIAVRHRNALETWSSNPLSFNNVIISYSFNDSISKAWGNRMKSMGDGNFALYSGDVDQNGMIDEGDFSIVESDTQLFLTGYISADLNGDNLIESSDYSLLQNNASALITVAKP